MSKENYIIPIFVPHWGCPHDCVFCNQEEITGQKDRIKAWEVKQQINDYLTTIPKEAKRIEVAFYGGSFTGIEPDYQKELLSTAYKYLQQKEITGIRLSTRPDYIDELVLNRLKKYGVTAVELGVQSLNDKVLQSAGRGHTEAEVVAASKKIKEGGFQLGLQIMPGLPGSSREIDLETGRQIVKLAPNFVRIYPTLVLQGTELAQLYQAGCYKPLALEEAVNLSAQLLKMFKKAGIPVIRIGLQPSAGVSEEKIIAGPFHPSFRQLVESKLMLEKIIARGLSGEELTIKVNPRDISIVRGQKNKNLKILQTKYNVSEITIETNQQLARGEIKIS